MLRKLACIKTDVALEGNDAAFFNVDRQGLRDALLVGIRVRLPRLRVEESCPNTIILAVTIGKAVTKGGAVSGYYGSVRLQLLRPAVLLESGELGVPFVWDFSWALAGSTEQGRSHVMGVIDDLITKFAAAYYEADNP